MRCQEQEPDLQVNAGDVRESTGLSRGARTSLILAHPRLVTKATLGSMEWLKAPT